MIDTLTEIEQFAIVGGLLFLLFQMFRFVFKRHRFRNAYERIPKLMTPAEQRFYKALVQSIQGRAIIMSKVRIADLVKVKTGRKEKRFWFYFSKISQKHIDFVLLDPVTFSTLCTIELDDSSHWRPDRMKRDRFINQLMVNTGIPLVRFKVQRVYDQEKIVNLLGQYL